MAPQRRKDDDPEDAIDWAKLRGSDTHTRWLVGVASTAIVSALCWFAVQDRNSVERRLQALESVTTALGSTQAADRAEANARWAEIQRSLERIESDVRVVKVRTK